MWSRNETLGRTLGQVLGIAQGYTHAGTTLQTSLPSPQFPASASSQVRAQNCELNKNKWKLQVITSSAKTIGCPRKIYCLICSPSLTINSVCLKRLLSKSHWCTAEIIIGTTVLALWRVLHQGLIFQFFSSQSLQSFALVESKLNGMHHKPAPHCISHWYCKRQGTVGGIEVAHRLTS